MPDCDPIASALRAYVDAGSLAGAATLVWRKGELVQRSAVGWQDLETRQPLEPDAIFRIASMSKPITSLAAMMLVEEGRIRLDEPITRVAPELSALRVMRSPKGSLHETDAARRPITFEALLTHRSGLTYSDFLPAPLARAYREALGAELDSELSPDAWISALASLPLVAEPGEAFHYGCSTDLLGLLIARIEGAPLGDVLARRIFEPLGMKDTGFVVPAEKRSRRAGTYGFDEAGRLAWRSSGPGRSFLPERPAGMTFVSGGQGLWSTVDDYLAFARLFVEQGSVDGVRLLGPETIAQIASNQLSEGQRASARLMGMPLFRAGHGFGLGVAVVMEPSKATPHFGRGAVGTVGWPGAFGGFWQADPRDRSVLVFLTHNLVELHQLASGVGLEVYDAMARFQTLATESGASATGLATP